MQYLEIKYNGNIAKYCYTVDSSSRRANTPTVSCAKATFGKFV